MPFVLYQWNLYPNLTTKHHIQVYQFQLQGTLLHCSCKELTTNSLNHGASLL